MQWRCCVGSTDTTEYCPSLTLFRKLQPDLNVSWGAKGWVGLSRHGVFSLVCITPAAAERGVARQDSKGKSGSSPPLPSPPPGLSSTADLLRIPAQFLAPILFFFLRGSSAGTITQKGLTWPHADANPPAGTGTGTGTGTSFPPCELCPRALLITVHVTTSKYPQVPFGEVKSLASSFHFQTS